MPSSTRKVHWILENRMIMSRFRLFPHQFLIPFLIWRMAPIGFSVSPQVPLANNFPLSEREPFVKVRMYQYMLNTTKLAVANLFAPLLRFATTPCTYRCTLSAFSHISSNVMRGRKLLLRHSVKHYEAMSLMDKYFIRYYFTTYISGCKFKN